MCRCRRKSRRRAQPALTRRPGSPRFRGRARPRARLRTRRSNSAAAPMALAGDKICSLVRRRIKRRAVQRAAALRAHKNNMHPGQNAAPGGATAQPQRCALTKKTCTSHPLPKITPPFTRRSSMYITFRTQSLVHTPIMHRERVHSQLQLSPLIWVQCRAHLKLIISGCQEDDLINGTLNRATRCSPLRSVISGSPCQTA